MQSIFIRFVTEQDRVRGFATLAKRAQISSLPGQVYQVPIDGLGHLEAEHINYRRATDAEVKAANDQVRNPAAPVLQSRQGRLTFGFRPTASKSCKWLPCQRPNEKPATTRNRPSRIAISQVINQLKEEIARYECRQPA